MFLMTNPEPSVDSTIQSSDDKDIAYDAATLMVDAEPSQQFEGYVSDLELESTNNPLVTHPGDGQEFKHSNGPWFYFDNVPIHKRRETMHLFATWIDN